MDCGNTQRENKNKCDRGSNGMVICKEMQTVGQRVLTTGSAGRKKQGRLRRMKAKVNEAVQRRKIQEGNLKVDISCVW